jgi:hypothetical protein
MINWIRRKLDWPPYRTQGVVTASEFTFGGAGNQWTIIDGIIYVTYWNAFTKDWNIGDRVNFTVRWGRRYPQFRGPLEKYANNITKATP